jgi:hypothetical protein
VTALRAVVLTAVLPACVELGGIRLDVCGNGATEAGEDCDIYGGLPSPNGHMCGPPEDSLRACRWICTGSTTCPSGWGCGQDGVCRRPSGVLLPLAETSPAVFSDFVVGDVDGDGRRDLVGRTRQPGVDVFYGDGEGAFAGPDRVPSIPESSGAGIGDIDSDGRLDVVTAAPGGGVIVALGDDDRSLATVLHPQFGFPPTPAQTISALDLGSQGQIVALLERPGGVTVAIPTLDAGVMVPADYAALGPPVRADLDGDGDHDLVLVAAGSPTAWVLRLDAAATTPFEVSEIQLPAGASLGGEAEPPGIAGPPVIVGDVDGDGLLDLVFRLAPDLDGRVVAVARGLAGGDFAAAAVDPRFDGLAGMVDAFCDLPVQPWMGGAMPLTAADLDDDGDADYAGIGGIFLTLTDGGGQPHLCRVSGSTAGWSEAVALDFNRDGKLDVVGTSGQLPEVELFLGDGTGAFARFGIDLQLPARSLRVGDFDGDRVPDVGLLVSSLLNATTDVTILFGALQGAPAPVSMGTIGSVGSFEPLRLASFNGEVDLIDDLMVEWVDNLETSGRHQVAMLIGTTARRMIAPLILDASVVAVSAVQLGKFDGDELADLAVVTNVSTSLSVLSARGQGQFVASGVPAPLCPGVPVLEGASVFFRAGDLVGDGRDELVYASAPDVGSPEASTLLLLQTVPSSEDFTTFECFPLATGDLIGISDVIIADLDADGHRDLLVVGTVTGPFEEGVFLQPRAWIFWSDGISVGLPEVVPGLLDSFAGALGVLQADTDPALELVIQVNDVLTLVDIGSDRTFAPGIAIEASSGAASIIRAGDVDGDQLEDLVISSDYGTRILLMEPAAAGQDR